MNPEANRINRDLLKKYDRPGPRYTSYPTVPEWSSDFGSAEYIKALQEASIEDSPLSLYFHIPFCRSRCSYCGCTTVISKGGDRIDRYIDWLSREVELAASHLGRRTRVVQMHWGGGTPTFLTNPQIDKLFTGITDHFKIERESELAIEVDPRVTTPEHIQLLRSLGFNRLSMGVQDLTPEVQEAIGRDQTLEQTESLFKFCRKSGFSGINIDLIYGLPYQTVENFTKTIAEVIRMGVDRIAVYSFAYLPGMKPHQKLIKEETLPAPGAKFELFATAVEKFLEAGYVQIGMDHFARPDDELAKSLNEGKLYRNFMGYTTRSTSASVGFGMSAISEVSGVFAQNISKIDSYGVPIEAGRLATFRGFRLSDDDKIRQRAILSLMCNFVLEFDAMDKLFKIDSRKYFAEELVDLKQFVNDSLMEITDDNIKVLPRGQIFVRNMAMVFDAYLRGKGKDNAPTFSRTI